MNRTHASARRRSLGRRSMAGARDTGCAQNGGSWHVVTPISTGTAAILRELGFTDEQLQRYVRCRLCDRVGPPELVQARPGDRP
jgi:hypothetical protein